MLSDISCRWCQFLENFVNTPLDVVGESYALSAKREPLQI
jgi:hypothetical protein